MSCTLERPSSEASKETKAARISFSFGCVESGTSTDVMIAVIGSESGSEIPEIDFVESSWVVSYPVADLDDVTTSFTTYIYNSSEIVVCDWPSATSSRRIEDNYEGYYYSSGENYEGYTYSDDDNGYYDWYVALGPQAVTQVRKFDTVTCTSAPTLNPTPSPTSSPTASPTAASPDFIPTASSKGVSVATLATAIPLFAFAGIFAVAAAIKHFRGGPRRSGRSHRSMGAKEEDDEEKDPMRGGIVGRQNAVEVAVKAVPSKSSLRAAFNTSTKSTNAMNEDLDTLIENGRRDVENGSSVEGDAGAYDMQEMPNLGDWQRDDDEAMVGVDLELEYNSLNPNPTGQSINFVEGSSD